MEWIAKTLRVVLGVPACDVPTRDVIRAGSDEPGALWHCSIGSSSRRISCRIVHRASDEPGAHDRIRRAIRPTCGLVARGTIRHVTEQLGP